MHRYFQQARGASTTNTGSCPPHPSPTYIPLLAQTVAANSLGNVLLATAQRLGQRQDQAHPVTSSLDMLIMAATQPLLGINQFYPSEIRTRNQPPGSQHHIYSGTQQPIPIRATGNETPSIDPAYLAPTYGGYDGSQIRQRIMPQRMSPYKQPVRGVWLSSGGGSSWQGM